MSKRAFRIIVQQLLADYAYVPTRTGLPIASVRSTSIHEGMTVANFRNMFAPHSAILSGPRGGERRMNPVDAWMSHANRLTVEALQLRPDQSGRVFSENNKLYINVYTPVAHPSAGGDATKGIEFLEQLLPDETERLFFTRWLAHKLRYPAIPGPAVVHLARTFGSGRGTLSELVKRLLGQRYVKTVGFDIVAGRNQQSQYNDWAADSLVVVVNESSSADGASPYRAKHDTYEHLKELIDPSVLVRHFVVKGLPAFEAPCFASYIIATNNADALPLPPGDRRFWVGTNGGPRSQEYWDNLRTWMDDPDNIGAFARYLSEVPLGDYSPYRPPPMTAGKAAMTELSQSSLDRALDVAIAGFPGDVFVPSQLFHAMEKAREEEDGFPSDWRKIARRLLSRRGGRVGQRDGPNYQLKFGNGKKHGVYTKTLSRVDEWTKAPVAVLRAEVIKNGEPWNENVAAFTAAKALRSGGTKALPVLGS